MRIWTVYERAASGLHAVAVCTSENLANLMVERLPGRFAFSTAVDPATYDLVFGMNKYIDVTSEYKRLLQPGLVVCRKVEE